MESQENEVIIKPAPRRKCRPVWRRGQLAQEVKEISPDLDLGVIAPAFGWRQVRGSDGRLLPMYDTRPLTDIEAEAGEGAKDGRIAQGGPQGEEKALGSL